MHYINQIDINGAFVTPHGQARGQRPAGCRFGTGEL
jgi:hypothetical protein